ncbi:MAG TPA: glycosyltransferase [Candidatus Methanofastidiosum sp.]|nr:glycosyltransferase [Methanofastidiosum sp.]
MKILHVIPYFTPKRGGDVNVCYNLSKQIVKGGHDVTIITTDFEFDEKYTKDLEETGIKVVPFHCVANIKLFLISPSMKKWLKKEIKTFDIIHMHDFRSYQNVIVYHYAKKYIIPYVLQPHGSTPRVIEKKKLKWLFDVAFGYKILKDATGVIAVSKEEAEYDRQMGADDKKISVIYNGMDIESFKSLPEREKFKEKYDIQGKMILYLGRIHKSKGIDIIINAYTKLIKEMGDIALVIAGSDDGYKKELERLAEKLNLGNKVKFTGFVDENDKMAAYVDADLFVHTVRYMGGVGLTPLEAILCNTPVIVTEECGEVIKEANCGYLVKYGDVEGLKEKIKVILEKPEEVKELVEKGKKYIIENLTWNKATEKILRKYLETLE